MSKYTNQSLIYCLNENLAQNLTFPKPLQYQKFLTSQHKKKTERCQAVLLTNHYHGGDGLGITVSEVLQYAPVKLLQNHAKWVILGFSVSHDIKSHRHKNCLYLCIRVSREIHGDT